ncbi:alkaline phosphatase [Limisalsivibrio acetivorans]|uniref:alkaline phosphatase n=1 Tax=Limisalsivibrio acetivorans TaxID=1304888 RepID=UPI0003B72A93|nr:alkaline phosphatase [Limisalsivibrio acetivorans]
MNKFALRMLTAIMLVAVFTAGAWAKAPKYVFYFIGDGLGASQRQVAEYYAQQVKGDKNYKLIMNTFPVAGINTTNSTDSLVTDSAAAGTALATGYKTNNGVISKLPDGRDVKSLIEVAETKGWVTGIASTTRLTHATPAVFASHNESRGNENEIAADMADAGVEYIAGGGYRHFVSKDSHLKSKRKSGDVVSVLKDMGYVTYVGEKASMPFRNFKPNGQKVFAGLTYSHMPYEVDRMNTNDIPSIAELTAKGIEVLSQHNKPFFFMIEGGRIDHACHANDVAGSVHDTLAFNAAVEEAYSFYKQHPEETLIVVVGDHETGGLGLGFAKNYFLKTEAINAQKASVDDKLSKAYTGDEDAFFAYLEKNFGLNDLSDRERMDLKIAMKVQDKSEGGKSAYGYTPTQIAVAHLMSERANVQWTTFAHTATQIPMSAIGVGAERFGGFKDNTQIAHSMAELLGFRLSSYNVASK